MFAHAVNNKVLKTAINTITTIPGATKLLRGVKNEKDIYITGKVGLLQLL